MSYRILDSKSYFLTSTASDLRQPLAPNEGIRLRLRQDKLDFQLKDRQLLLKIKNISIPVSFYQINSTNNTIRVQVAAGPITSITIPPGSYTAITLPIVLNSLFISLFQTLNLANRSLTWSINRPSGRLQVVWRGNVGETVNLLTSTSDRVIGLGTPTTFTVTGAGLQVGNAVTALLPRLADLQPQSELVLISNNLSARHLITDVITGELRKQNVLSTVQIAATVDPFEKITIGEEDEMYLQNSEVDSIELSWRFRDNQPVDFNGLRWYVELELQAIQWSDEIRTEN
jgi:hypothetical protein